MDDKSKKEKALKKEAIERALRDQASETALKEIKGLIYQWEEGLIPKWEAIVKIDSTLVQLYGGIA